ncbi:DVU_1553 family AMP-dependent CoA ligase [Desulfallas thermosapovorans]|uniref:Phenylacetate-coenzyme A ligase PaaK-like adenylate-forming protein n=1 Tax=Desulfallas thermosapovorans DSM 6562 TaxID=1121431 RepID=A0A5S4ZPJ8_9FIRM|nr:AMP-binding protein [Desulfallas thermosapovorans]TYO94603.1 phenylacetate-coenzyme A ligase PaaK-like adenylate-forming protein [Desulfallas thermosapovorans DSM 6562]
MITKTPLEQWILNKITASAGFRSQGHAGGLTRGLIESYQLAKLKETVALARGKSLFYRAALAGFTPDKIKSLRDLSGLPFTTAEDIRQNPLRFLCCSQDDIKRVVTLESSGTTGMPKRIFFTAADQELTRDYYHHGMTVVSRPGDRVIVLLPCERPGSVGDLFAESVRRMDVVPVRHGIVRDPGYTLEVMARERVDTLLGIPTQVLALACHEPPGQDKFGLKIKNVILNTDHLSRAIIHRITERWHCRVFNQYAMTEMGLGGGLECAALAGYHMREADLLFEIIDPVTGAVLPDGQEGEIVFTTLTRRGMPLIRYRTGDMGRFIPGPCPCGTVLKRMAPVRDRVRGRIPLAGGGFLSMAVLDDALFATPGVLNFKADILPGSGTDCLAVKVHLAGWAGEELAVLIQKTLLAVPVIAENVKQGALTVAPVEIDRSGELWPPAKRLIRDLRNNGDRPA